MNASSRTRLFPRDAVRVILSNLDDYYESTPQLAFRQAEAKLARMTREALERLRKRRFGTLPNSREAAVSFLRRRFQEHKDNYDALAESDIESFTSTESSSTESSSTESSSTDSSSTASTGRTVRYDADTTDSESDAASSSSSSTDSQRTVPVSLTRFVPYVDKYGYLVKSEGSIEI